MTATTGELIARRARLLGPNVSTFYDEPVHLVKGEGVWVWDAAGRKYLDCYNNVPHVGHAHPAVVEAIAAQAAMLNTHTRYLHEGILDYVEALTQTFAAPLGTAIMTCTGSEANDIALRMACATTGNRGIIASDHTYHGNTTAVSQLSRTNPPPGGAGDHIDFVPAPDSYRPPGGAPGRAHAADFAHEITHAIDRLGRRGHGISCLIICPFFANEGFPDLPPGWLAPAVAEIRKAGGIIIADEVQPGFGRIGPDFWGHRKAGIAPDIVTLGKPMANGHPVGGVVTSPAIMAAFRNSFRYFNTFGGNPVSAAAAHATLRVTLEEKLPENARKVGDYARKRLHELSQRHECIGDVRGSGLFFGAEMVRNRATREPATKLARRIANAMREEGILLNFLGIHYNTLKIRPPLTITIKEMDLMLNTLDHVLAREAG